MTITSTIRYQRNPVTGEVMLDTNGYPQIIADAQANTLAAMRARIELEVQGAITDSETDDAIRNAIAQYERESFWFNDMRTFGTTGSAASFNTTRSKEFYSADDLATLGNWPHIRTMMVLAFGNRYPLRERTQAWMDDASISPNWNGLPTDWCWIGQSIRIYPIPNMTYPLIVTGTIRFPQVVADTDTSPFLNEGERLTRSEAKRILYREITRDSAQADVMELEVMGDPRTGRQGALGMLRRESMRRAGGPGKLRGSRGFM
jgi:hypothetical protein